MQLKSLWLAVILAISLWQQANANDHQLARNGWLEEAEKEEKVLSGQRLSDDLSGERDKSSELQLRHEQQHLMAWELRLQQNLQQHLLATPVPMRHHQHKSRTMSKKLRKKAIKRSPSQLQYNEYHNDDLELHTMEEWQQIEIAHRRKKEQHQRQRQMQLQRQQTTAESATAESNAAKSEDNDVRNTGKTLEDNDGHETGNIISNNYLPGSSTRRKIELHKEGYSKKRFSDMNKLAQENVRRVAREAICRIPQKRCLLVQQDTSKEYWPRCAILHRCSEDSGCCRKGKICAAKSTHNVELYFFVYNLKDSRTVEKRTFVNHTECHCIERSNYNVETAMAVSSPVRATILSCTCPSAFEKVLQDDGQCRCDCTSSNAGCDSLKRGIEHFSLKDRKCIEQGRCMPPTCEYGHFMKQQGGCPKQHEHPIYSVMS
ncbi:uncharacterized protein LOC6507092 isoform X3 [Drosophila ananassae]|uniref:uncharacterized protein LOC6507092 isoform X3 n=1 Tax=Drosophila ananassae TaxID=7217 RepID=UPI000177E89F|nr:uncharacterized protein LOC6507092 isoform X3 [Drosophila ananassae]